MTFESMTRWRPATGATALTLDGRVTTLLDRARVYACGITPYDMTHLGHAATFVWVDTLRRVLRTLGVEPILCRNVTDVDDVIDTLTNRPGHQHVIITGRRADPRLIEIAQLVTEMTKIKHPFDEGQKGQRGIEW